MIPIKILLAAINAKYIHSSLALRSLLAYCATFQESITSMEFSINQRKEFILKEIYEEQPDVIGFSCYIWNVEMIKALVSDLKKVLPETIILLGGPEITAADLYTFGDIFVFGEGESPFYALMEHFLHKKPALQEIGGIGFYHQGHLQINPPGTLPDLDSLPFPYDDTNMAALSNKIIYYEASRGCPFNCQYCLSSNGGGEGAVRFLSLPRVKKDLDFFLEAKVKQVKFVDRTFNCNKKRAREIWSYLMAMDNSFTNFHFEISADLLDDESLALLARARKGLFQLEIGVQSTNEDTLQLIKRKTSLNTLFRNVEKLARFGNIHQHLDLIAGLPGEDYASFQKSFNDVYRLQPEMLQLGFLKLLKGSGLRRDAKDLGIIYSSQAPYEVLYTKELSFPQMLWLKGVEDMVERFYNSGGFRYSLRYLVPYFPTAYDFFHGLAHFWEDQGFDGVSHNKMALYQALYKFSLLTAPVNPGIVKNLIKFDLFIQENLKNVPDWLFKTDYTLLRNKISNFYENSNHINRYYPELQKYTTRQISRMCRIEHFGFDVLGWIKDNIIIEGDFYILFHYYGAEKNIGNCRCYTIDL